MSKNKVIKSVSFNITNEADAEMLKAIKRRNFSGYVKKLIMADIEARKEEKTQNEPVEPVKNEVVAPVKRLTAAEKLRQRKTAPTTGGAPNIFKPKI